MAGLPIFCPRSMISLRLAKLPVTFGDRDHYPDHRREPRTWAPDGAPVGEAASSPLTADADHSRTQQDAAAHFCSRKSLKIFWRLSQIMTPCSHGASCFPVHLCPSTTRSPLTLLKLVSSLWLWFIGTS